MSDNPQTPRAATDQFCSTGSDLTRAQWVYAFSLVTSLFFTWGFAYGVSPLKQSA